MKSLEENQIVELLAQIYAIIPWQKMKTRHNAYDIFNHRVRAAARRGTLGQFISKLCNYFGLQQAPMACVEIIDNLKPQTEMVLGLIYSEHVYICMKAIGRAKEIKKTKKGE